MTFDQLVDLNDTFSGRGFDEFEFHHSFFPYTLDHVFEAALQRARRPRLVDLLLDVCRKSKSRTWRAITTTVLSVFTVTVSVSRLRSISIFRPHSFPSDNGSHRLTVALRVVAILIRTSVTLAVCTVTVCVILITIILIAPTTVFVIVVVTCRQS